MTAEAELMRLCDRLVAIAAENLKLYATMPAATRAEERQLEGCLKPSLAEWDKVTARILDLDTLPKTPEGINAVARAALAEAPRRPNGEIITRDLCEYLTWSVLEAIEPDANALIKADVRNANEAVFLRMASVPRRQREDRS